MDVHRGESSVMYAVTLTMLLVVILGLTGLGDHMENCQGRHVVGSLPMSLSGNTEDTNHQ